MSDERTYPLQTRIDEEMRKKLEAAAKANCRAVSAEAYIRLKASFETSDRADAPGPTTEG